MKKRVLITVFIMLYDALAVTFASVLGMLAEPARWELLVNSDTNGYIIALAVNVVTVAIVFNLLHLYSNVMEYISVFEGIKLLAGISLVSLVHCVFTEFLLSGSSVVTIGYALVFVLIFAALTLAVRYAKRIALSLKAYVVNKQNGNRIPVMIVGAGDAGVALFKEIENSERIKYAVKCFVDDDVQKIGTYIGGIKVFGNRSRIADAVKKYGVKEIYIAMPSQSGEKIEEIVKICAETGCKVKKLPGIYQFVNGEISTKSLSEVSIEDLLARDAVNIDVDKIMQYVSDKVVMVTGGGGSIGSELCRQIASHNPNKLIIVDIYENNAYDIQQELIKKYPTLKLITLIASVRDEKRMERIFATYKPQIVYHAAAHKHVPLMEDSPNEAIKNNVFGTYNIAKLADKYKTKRFVLISTDKAVNPTNVMGATKRICEMIVQGFGRKSETEFVAVRFGNVLGSNGSVVPLFKKQIAAGGPVLVTHPEIIRYFMTISEAVALVIQAGAYAKGGEIFVLDMGKPVKILHLAEKLIQLSGYVPYKEIPIKFTGLRPGEKLYEEMLMDEEGLQETENKLIHIGKPIEFNEDEFFEQLKNLRKVIEKEPTNTRKIISEIVPTYKGNVDLNNI